jgi:hypothetical protein
MSVFIVNEKIRRQIRAKIAKARRLTTPLQTTKKYGFDDDRPTLTYGERETEFLRTYPPQSMIIGSYQIAFSFEEQPSGLYRHISVSVAQRGKTPHPTAMQMIIKEFGFDCVLDAPPSRPARVWLEEFEPGHHAINVTELEPN